MGQIEIGLGVFDLECPAKGLAGLVEQAARVIDRFVSLVESDPGAALPDDLCQAVRQIQRNFLQAVDIYQTKMQHGHVDEAFKATVQLLKDLRRPVERFEAHFNIIAAAERQGRFKVGLEQWRECVLAAIDLKHTLQQGTKLS